MSSGGLSDCVCCKGTSTNTATAAAAGSEKNCKKKPDAKKVVSKQPRTRGNPGGATGREGAAIAAPEHVSLSVGTLKARMEAQLAGLVSRLETVATRLEVVATGTKGGATAAAPPGGSEPEVAAAFVTAFDQIINGPLASFIEFSQQLGGDVKEQSDIVRRAFAAQRAFLVLVAKAKAPEQAKLADLLQPTSAELQAVQEFREAKRQSAQFNHLSAISESIPALGWVTVSPAPGPFVKEMTDAGQFYGNRVLKEFREKDKKHVEWSRSWFTTLTQLMAYIKQYHTTGVSWNAQGVDAASIAGSKRAAPAAPSGGPPPPPPPGPPPAPGPPPPSSGASAPDDNRSALFSELNRGEDVTKGLRKVSDTMKIHKNPSLKLQTPQPYRPTAAPKPNRRPSAGDAPAACPAPKHAPVCKLDGKKWIVEYQEGNKNVVISETNSKQSVYAFRCVDTVIQVKGKVNSITMDNCRKTAVVFEDIISSVDFVNCRSVQAQVTGKVPTISIDKTDGCMVYLSEASKETEIVTAKSSEMNILIPDKNGEFKEYAIPEQFKTRWNGKKLVTLSSDINQ